MIGHAPRRGSYRCHRCLQPWPCARAVRQLMTLEWRTRAGYLRDVLEAAAWDLDVTGARMVARRIRGALPRWHLGTIPTQRGRQGTPARP